jgi:hypothetical protein
MEWRLRGAKPTPADRAPWFIEEAVHLPQENSGLLAPVQAPNAIVKTHHHFACSFS